MPLIYPPLLAANLLCYPRYMRARARKNRVLSLAFLAAASLGQVSARADGAGTGNAGANGQTKVMGASHVTANSDQVTMDDFKNPDIVKPDDLGAPCNLRANQQEIGQAARDSGVRLADQCMPQADAFKRAAEASSYLAYYQQNYSTYAALVKDPATKAKIEEAIRDCMAGSNCDETKKTYLISALVQYNFGKQLKSQMLENQRNAEKMASLDQSAKDWKDMGVSPTHVLKGAQGLSNPNSGSLRQKTFRLDPLQITANDFSSKTQQERALLGNDAGRAGVTA